MTTPRRPADACALAPCLGALAAWLAVGCSGAMTPRPATAPAPAAEGGTEATAIGDDPGTPRADGLGDRIAKWASHRLDVDRLRALLGEYPDALDATTPRPLEDNPLLQQAIATRAAQCDANPMADPSVLKVIALTSRFSRSLYEAGQLYSLLEAMRALDQAEIGLAAVSSGAGNALVGGISFCESTPHGPERHRLWQAWRRVTLDALFPGDRTCEAFRAAHPDYGVDCSRGSAYAQGDGIVASAAWNPLRRRLLADLTADPTPGRWRKGCRVPVGIQLFSETPARARPDEEDETVRALLQFELRTLCRKDAVAGDEVCRIAACRLDLLPPDATARTVANVHPPHLAVQLPDAISESCDEVDAEALVDLVVTSTSMPVLQPRPAVRYCGTDGRAVDGGTAHCPAGTRLRSGRFIDGGAIDAQPIDAARRLWVTVKARGMSAGQAANPSCAATGYVGAAVLVLDERVLPDHVADDLEAPWLGVRAVIDLAQRFSVVAARRALVAAVAEWHDCVLLWPHRGMTAGRLPLPPLAADQLFGTGGFFHPQVALHDYLLGVHDGLRIHAALATGSLPWTQGRRGIVAFATSADADPSDRGHTAAIRTIEAFVALVRDHGLSWLGNHAKLLQESRAQAALASVHAGLPLPHAGTATTPLADAVAVQVVHRALGVFGPDDLDASDIMAFLDALRTQGFDLAGRLPAVQAPGHWLWDTLRQVAHRLEETERHHGGVAMAGAAVLVQGSTAALAERHDDGWTVGRGSLQPTIRNSRGWSKVQQVLVPYRLGTSVVLGADDVRATLRLGWEPLGYQGKWLRGAAAVAYEYGTLFGSRGHHVAGGVTLEASAAAPAGLRWLGFLGGDAPGPLPAHVTEVFFRPASLCRYFPGHLELALGAHLPWGGVEGARFGVTASLADFNGLFYWGYRAATGKDDPYGDIAVRGASYLAPQ